MKLSGALIAVTGAARGLGFACAKQLIEAGARVALIDFDKQRLQQTKLHKMI